MITGLFKVGATFQHKMGSDVRVYRVLEFTFDHEDPTAHSLKISVEPQSYDGFVTRVSLWDALAQVLCGTWVPYQRLRDASGEVPPKSPGPLES